jgi:long-chain acyl-CoA synthetase
MMLGSCKRPEATAEAMRDGWFHTGDLESEAEKGHLKLSMSSAKKT